MSASVIRLPAALVARAEDLAAGRIEPATPRNSATVAMLRDDADGFQVYMIRRARSMAFAAGMYAFPGGSVDTRDGDVAARDNAGDDAETVWAGPSPEEWAAVLGVSPVLAAELVCAAVRETFEEAGVLLAGPSPDAVVDDVRGADWEADRQALVARTLSFSQFLRTRKLMLRSDLLRPWAQWVTPQVEQRRFDTRFFVAELPYGQRARDVSGEADRVTWVRPAEAVRAARQGELRMFPPTMVTLVELAAWDSVAAALAAPRRIRPRLPEVTVTDGQAYLVLPEELR